MIHAQRLEENGLKVVYLMDLLKYKKILINPL